MDVLHVARVLSKHPRVCNVRLSPLRGSCVTRGWTPDEEREQLEEREREREAESTLKKKKEKKMEVFWQTKPT